MNDEMGQECAFGYKYQNIFHIKSQESRGTDWHASALGNGGTGGD